MIHLAVEVLARGEPGVVHWLLYGDRYDEANRLGCKRSAIGMVQASGWPPALTCPACIEACVAAVLIDDTP